MFIDTKNSIENHILEILKTGPVNTVELIKIIKKKRANTTKQGIYRVLRLLSKREVVVIHNKEVSLNIRWLNKMNKYYAIAQHYYFQRNIGVGHFTNLQPGEKNKYTFRNLSLTDAFWNHIIYILLEITDSRENWFGYNSHAWFFWLGQVRKAPS